jgi:hypothetical protein
MPDAVAQAAKAYRVADRGAPPATAGLSLRYRASEMAAAVLASDLHIK